MILRAGFCSAIVLIGLFVGTTTSRAEERIGPMRIAVTVDDLPGDLPPGMTGMAVTRGVVKALKENGVSRAYGFTNGAIAANSDLINILRMWLGEGYLLGNHTYSHMNLDNVGEQDFVADIDKMQNLLDNLVRALDPIESVRFFRYPYLAEGQTVEKRKAIRHHLFKNGYRIAQVTIDYYDWAWNDAYIRCLARQDEREIDWLKSQIVKHSRLAAVSSRRISKLLFKRDIAQILLLHDTPFDAVTLGAVLKDFRQQGVRLISLDEALEDPVYQIDPNHVFSGGLTFLAQVAAARDVAVDFEDQSTVSNLDHICK